MSELRSSKHTIVLVQYSKSNQSRTYLDFESVNGAMNGVVKLYEYKLKQLNPSVNSITYDVEDLYQYMDTLEDLSALVFDSETSTYKPFGREWIKKKIYQILKNQAHE